MNRVVFYITCVSADALQFVPLALIALIIGQCDRVQAQAVVSDGTLNTIVTRSGNVFTINNGTTAGTNLFHSFREFSIPTGGSAVFNNTPNIQNIFSRVTGGTVSNIDGLIQARGNANLFLLNPSGILFGANASLNIGGSFVGTTAQSIKFADGIEFSATDDRPLLTISAPIGFQMGQTPSKITHLAPTGFRVKEQKSLLLVGGEIFLDRARLTAPSGNIELAAISGAGTLSLSNLGNSLQLNPSEALPRNNITLSNAAWLDVRAARGGRLALYAQNLTLSELSYLRAGNEPSGQVPGTAGDIILDVRDRISLNQGRVENRAERGSRANSGHILLKAGSFEMTNGSFLSTSTNSNGQAGNIQIRLTGDLGMRGFDREGSSRIASNSDGVATGNAGNIQIEAASIELQDGASIGANANALGQGGSVKLQATERITLSGIGANRTSSRISTQSSLAATGNGGDMRIIAKDLTLSEGGMLRSQAGGGDGGNIFVDVQTLTLSDGGQISTVARRAGDAGTIDLKVAQDLKIQGSYPTPFPRSLAPSDLVAVNQQYLSGIYASATAEASGDGGTLYLQAGQLNLQDGAQINVGSLGQGSAGNLLLQADRVSLDRQSALLAEVTNGSQGNIDISTPLLLLRRGSQITTTAQNISTGGNIKINAAILVGLENSDIFANATQGNGGRIDITTQGIIGLAFRNVTNPRAIPTNDISAKSEQIGFDGTVQIKNFGIDPNSGLVALPVNLKDPSQSIAKECSATQGSSFIISGRGGIPTNPIEDSIRRDRTWQDFRPLSTARQSAVESTPALIEATGLQRDANGKVHLIAAQPMRSPQFGTCAETVSQSEF
jgi:filamentous hemagglutinin family protein